MKEPTNAELAFRIKQLEDRLRVARVDFDRMNAEVEELRRLLHAREESPPAPRPGIFSSPKADPSLAQKQPAPETKPESRPVPKAEPAAAERAGTRSDTGIVARTRTEHKPAQPSAIAKLVAAIKARVGGIPLEEFVGLNLLNKLGVLMLLVGGGFFLRIAYQWVGPELKLAGLTVLAAAALFAGEYFFRKDGARGNYRLFGLGLAAGGSVLLFFNAFAAYHVDATKVIPDSQAGFAYLLLLLVAGGIVANSLRYDSEAFTGFAYLLAFVSISINESEASAERFTGHFALIALAILAASLIVVLSLRRWKFLGVLGLLGTYANFFWYATALPRTLDGYVWRGEALPEAIQNLIGTPGGPGPDYFLFAFLYLAIYWIIFSVSLFTMPATSAMERRIGVWLHTANVLCFYSLVAYIRPAETEWGAFAVTAGLGLACLAIGVAGRLTGRAYLWTISVILGLGLLALALPFRFSEYALVFGWLMMATLLIALGYQTREKLFRYAGYLILLVNVGAFLDLPAGDMFYGYGPDALLEEPAAGGEIGQEPALPEAGAPLWAFDWNRGLLYVFMLVCLFGLQIFAALLSRAPARPAGSAARDQADDGAAAKASIAAGTAADALLERTAFDQIAWHCLGGLGVVVAVLLSHYSLLLGQQALGLVPFAVLFLLAHRMLRIAPFYLYPVILIWAALLSAGSLIAANEGPGAPLYQQASLLLLFAGGALAYFYHRFFAPGTTPGPDDASAAKSAAIAWRVSSQVPARLLAGIALWVPAIVAPSFCGYQIDERLTILGAAAAAAGLGAIYWRYRQGLLALFALSSFSVLFVTVLYILQNFESEEFQNLFLWNSGWLWLAAIAGAATIHVARSRRRLSSASSESIRSGLVFAGALAVAALIATAWIQIQLHTAYAPFRALAILVYALVLAATLRWRGEFSARLLPVALAGLAFLVGPLAWIIEHGSADSGGGALAAVGEGENFVRYLRAVLAAGFPALLAAAVAVCAHSARGARDAGGFLTLAFAFAAVHLLVPAVYRPSAYALLTLGGYYLLDRLRSQTPDVARDEWTRLLRLAPAAFVITMLSFAALILDYSGATTPGGETSAPLELRAIMGVIPLVFLAFSLALHGDLFGDENRLTPFQRGAYPALLLAFVLLTMSLVAIGWWSLVWAVLGVAGLVAGILRNLKLLRYGGFVLILLALLKLSLWDIRELESTARVIVLVCVGVSLVVASYFYARFKDLLFPKE